MPAVTPAQLLKALNPLLDKTGGMRDVESSTRIVSLMKDATKLVSKCIYVNICLHTASEEVLQKFIITGGWSLLSKWLQEAKDSDNMVFIVELLKVYQCLPVSVDDLKQDNTARFIKGLTKHSDEDIKTLSNAVVDSWMKKIKSKSSSDNDNDKAKKKKKKDKDREKDYDKEKEKDRDKSKDKDKEKEKDRDKSKDKDKEEKDRDKSKDKDKEEKDRDKSKDKDKEEKDRDKSKDKDKEEKDRDKSKDKEKEKEKERHKHRSSDKKDSAHSSKSHHHSSKKDASEKKPSSSATDAAQRDKHASTESKEDNSENAESRLATESDAAQSKNVPCAKPSSAKEEDDEKTKRKPKTVRVFTNKFRSVFDEDDPAPLPPIKKKTAEELKPSFALVKRASADTTREEPPEKIPRLTLKILPPEPSDSLTSPTGTSPPEVTHGRIKIIAPKRPPAHEIHDSNVFMKELTKSSYMHGTIKRKKKPTPMPPMFPSSKEPTLAAAPKTTLMPSTPTTPTTPTSTTSPCPGPVSPLTPPAHKLPCVPSFYRDTLETAEEPETPPSKEERSPPPLEKMDTSNPDEATMADDEALEHSEPPTIDMETGDNAADAEGDLNAHLASEGGEQKDSAEGSPQSESTGGDNQDANGGSTSSRNGKKRVRWAEESRLRQVFYFELDETERENVNRPKTFNELKKLDMKSEGRAMETAKRLISDNMVEVLQWRRPPVIDSLTVAVEPGCNSLEIGIQQQRESGVLQALFFSKQMLPDSPSEPEVESVEPTDIKIIPLVDETCSGEEYEHTYNVDPASMPYDPAFDISQNLNTANSSGPTNGGGGSSSGNKGAIQLPPDINNMLASIQQQSIATGGRSLQANSAVMANVQSILAAIMHGGPNTNTDELINKLRVALDPLKNQISNGPMQGMTPNEPPFQPQPPQRHGLLGNAPPGFNPMMGPRQFGPQGPMMGGGMDGDWNSMGMGNMQGPNMGMRGGPMGPGFHPMQGPPGPMPGPGPNMGGSGPVVQGPRMRKNTNNIRGPDGRSVCRHFVAPTGCRFGNACAFLHPGVNGPPLNH